MSRDSRVPAAPAPEAPFLKDLFGALESSGIPYCVLRNYEGLPESLLGSDLDLLVGEGAALAATRRVIVETVDKHRGRMLWRAKNESLSSALCVAGAGTGAVWGVAIDVFTGLRWRGIDYYDARWLLSRARERDGVRVAGFCDASVVGVLKDLLEGGRLRPGKRYARDAATAFGEITPMERRIITGFFPGAEDQLARALGDGVPAEPRQLVRALRRALLRRFAASPLIFGRRLVKQWLIYGRRIRQPEGIFIAVLGFDGAGKSTIIDAVRADLDRLLHTETGHLYARPGLIPALSRWVGAKPEAPLPLIDPHAKPPSGTFMSFVRVAYYTLDYVAGYWLGIHLKLVREPTVIFFDRYFYDYFFDGKRFGVDLHPGAVSFFRLFIPEPKVTIMVRATPEVAHARKPELPVEEIRRQYLELSNLADKVAPVVWISSDEPLDLCRSKMLEVTLDALFDRG